MDIGFDGDISELQCLEIRNIEHESNLLTRITSEFGEESAVEFRGLTRNASRQLQSVRSISMKVRIESDHFLGFVSLKIKPRTGWIAEVQIEPFLALEFLRTRQNRDDHVVYLFIALRVKPYVGESTHWIYLFRPSLLRWA